ncbi:hypothetical protein [Methylobacterium sp. Leaf456]|uniref:hypothetical protein n=1 Tax=Methylobacterium sp. Leaf456 TaxID=1736382 RepID=UPI000B04D96E|nr:hypothetical protein [Methylobacterium sp. Leaf456]
MPVLDVELSSVPIDPATTARRVLDRQHAVHRAGLAPVEAQGAVLGRITDSATAALEVG